jgi:DNA invertase Pin-like site-specific DNA recombinase
MHKGQRVGYVRVSTVGQNAERQLEGIKLDKVFTEKASGKDRKRPQLIAALEYVREGDTLVVHSLDRLARIVEDLRRIVRELNSRGVSIELVENRLIFGGSADPPAQLMLTMLRAFAEFERELIRERQRESIAIAKAKGVYKGRKKVLGPSDVHELLAQAHAGIPNVDLARAYGSARRRCTNTCGQANPFETAMARSRMRTTTRCNPASSTFRKEQRRLRDLPWNSRAFDDTPCGR